MLNRCLLYVLSFVLLSIGLSIYYSENTSAASPYDNVLQLTTELRLTSLVPEFDQVYDYDEIIQLANEKCTGNGGIQNWEGEYITITNRFEGSSGRYEVRLIPKNAQSYVSWTVLGGRHMARVPGGSTSLPQYRLYADSGNIYCQQSTGGWAVISASPVIPEENIWLYFTNQELNYPDGYEGIDIPTEPPESKMKARLPNITYEYNDLALNFYSDREKNTAILEDYKIYWFASNATTDQIQTGEQWAVSGCTEPQFMNMYNVPSYGEYGIQAYYADEDCNIINVDDEGNYLDQNMIVAYIDGSIGGGSTSENSSIIEEDSKLTIAIKRINLMDNTLTALILAPIQLISNMATYNGSCSPINIPYIGDKSITFTCIRPMVTSHFPALYMTIATVMTGFITIHVALRTFGLAKNAASPAGDDRIEVVKL